MNTQSIQGGHRFRSFEDAQKFITTTDMSLPIPQFTQQGGAIKINPEWSSAEFEQRVIYRTEGMSEVETRKL